MKFAVDRIEDGVVVCENLDTGERIEVSSLEFPFSLYEGSILILENGIWRLDVSLEEQRRRSLRDRLERLKKKKTKEALEKGE